jgi:glycosyltransferase involved in cell wall biosynthesis
MNTHAILTELSKSDSCESIVFAPHEKSFDIDVKVDSYRIIRYVRSPMKRFMDAFFIVCQLIALYRKERFDILHCHGVDQIYFGSLFRKFIPSVVLVGMFRNDKMLKSGKRRIRRLTKSLPHVDKIISINPAITDILLTQDPLLGKKIVEIPLGIDLKFYKTIPSVLTNEVKYIISLGRLTGNKRLDVLIQAFSFVQQKYPQILLYIVGSGSELNRLKLLTHSLSIGDKVRFLGVKTGEGKIRLIKNAELFVFTSSAGEGLPGVLLEALACRKVIVANDYSIIKTLIKDGKTGLIYKYDSPEDLADKILLGLQNRQDLETKFIPHINETISQYDVEVIASKYAELYRTVLLEKQK